MSEWEIGITSDGRLLPLKRVNAFRAEMAAAGLTLRPLASRDNVKQPSVDHGTAMTSKRASAKTPSPPSFGPGDALKELLESLGISSEWCEGCTQRRAQMNRWGVSGCRQNVDVIARWLADAAREAGPREQLRAAWGAVVGGLWLNPLDPYRGLANRAIDAAEQRSAADAAR